MKKKIANAIELVLLIVSFIILNIQNMTIVGNSIWSEPYKVSAIDCMEKYTLQFVPMCVLYLLCVIMCVISIITKKTYKDGKAHSVLAVFLFISVNYNLISCISGDEIISNNFPGALFEAVLFLAVVVAFAKRSSLIADSPNKKQEIPTIVNNVHETTNADELKKYKDLFDNGAITQEEFEEKKKQLLNL